MQEEVAVILEQSSGAGCHHTVVTGARQGGVVAPTHRATTHQLLSGQWHAQQTPWPWPAPAETTVEQCNIKRDPSATTSSVHSHTQQGWWTQLASYRKACVIGRSHQELVGYPVLSDE
jgi:hypothetical protein